MIEVRSGGNQRWRVAGSGGEEVGEITEGTGMVTAMRKEGLGKTS